MIAFGFFSRSQSFLTPEDAYIGCVSTFWLANNQCGLDGQECGPYDNSTFEFRCPAKCDTSILQNPRTVGNQQTAFVPLIVGGGDSNKTYRGDTFICPAAIQAYFLPFTNGILTDSDVFQRNHFEQQRRVWKHTAHLQLYRFYSVHVERIDFNWISFCFSRRFSRSKGKIPNTLHRL